jgi:hypothetical protein
MFLSLGSCCIGNIAYHSRLVAEQGFYNDQPGTEAGRSEAWRKEGFLALMFMESTNVSKKHVSPAFAKPKLGVRCFSSVTFAVISWVKVHHPLYTIFVCKHSKVYTPGAVGNRHFNISAFRKSVK